MPPTMSIREKIAPDHQCLLDTLAKRVRSRGGRLLVVGGAVRDALLGYPPKDFDCEVFGLSADQVTEVLTPDHPFDAVGRSFGVFKLKGRPIDIALPRTENRIGRRHRDFSVRGDPHLSLAEAAKRRDFTINAISWEPLEDRIVDPVGGIGDLESRVLRHVSPAFTEDPLRVLRAVQFIARFELAPADSTIRLCRTLVQDDLSEERIFEEWRKLILRGIRPSAGLEFLRSTGWIRFYPELAALIGTPQDPVWHPEGDVWQHTLHCLDAFAAERLGDATEDLVVGLAVLCHDLGKPETTAFVDGRWRSRGHEQAGIESTRRFLRRLTRETGLIDAVLPLVGEHMKPAELHRAGASANAIRRLAHRVGRLDRLARVANADMDGRPPLPSGNRSVTNWMLTTAKSLQVERNAPKPIVLGRDVLALGIPPGPAVGAYVKTCFEAQLDGQFEDHEGGMAFLRELVETPPRNS